jgi:fucose permease
VLAAATNSHLIRYVELGSLLTLGAVLQLAAQLLRFWTPPFGLYVVSFFIQAAGLAYQDAHANTFVTYIKGAHRWLGFIHAMYALGCLVSPFVATAVAAKLSNRWPIFYLFLVGLGVFNVLATLVTFRDSLKVNTRSPPLEALDGATMSRTNTASRDVIDTLKAPAVYLLSLFYFFFIGASITAGGWVVEYLVSARNGKLPEVGYVSAGLWGGMFLGRLLLAEDDRNLLLPVSGGATGLLAGTKSDQQCGRNLLVWGLCRAFLRNSEFLLFLLRTALCVVWRRFIHELFPLRMRRG